MSSSDLSDGANETAGEMGDQPAVENVPASEEENHPPRPGPRQGPRVRRLTPTAWEGYSYLFNRQYKNTTYVVCKHYQYGKCKARGQITNGVFKLGEIAHICVDRDPGLLARNVFVSTLKEGMKRGRSAARVYEDAAKDDENSSIRTTFASKSRSMKRWKTDATKSIPGPKSFENYKYFQNFLTLEETSPFLEHPRGKATTILVETENTSSIVFWDTNFIKHFQNPSMLCIDGTFRVVPNIGRKDRKCQLLVVLAVQHNHAFPIAWVLMSHRTEEAYSAVFEVVLQQFVDYNRPVMTDFEVAMRNSLRRFLQSANICGCFFHYCQALQKRAKKHGILPNKDDGERRKKVLRKIMALALLPANRIREAFYEIRDGVPDGLKIVFQQFFKYFEDYWLNNRGPGEFCVYRQVRRTNNFAETNNALLNKSLPKRPSALNFTREIVNIMHKSHVRLLSVQEGNVVRSTCERNVINTIELNREWDELDAGLLDVHSFLLRGSNLVRKCVKPTVFVIIDDSNSDDEENPGPVEIVPPVTTDLLREPEHVTQVSMPGPSTVTSDSPDIPTPDVQGCVSLPSTVSRSELVIHPTTGKLVSMKFKAVSREKCVSIFKRRK